MTPNHPKDSYENYVADYKLFDEQLFAETCLLEKWFIEQRFMERILEIGSELEFFLLDSNLEPIPNNLKFIQLVNQPFLITEVGAAHLEINTPHFPLATDCLRQMHYVLLNYWRQCCQIARSHNYHLALIGSLPTATERHVQPDFITDKKRYFLIDTCMAEHRSGHPVTVHIEGEETLHLNPASIAINGLISAFQLHIQIGLGQSVRYYNTAQAIAGPVLAVCGNSPFLLGKHLWSDTRIASFDQVMTLKHFDRARGFKCCLFGTGYLKDSFFELFDQNYQYFPRLIPEAAPYNAVEEMFHVRRQNGVVYRWNRPVIDFTEGNLPHLRIEHRGPSAGPTIVDMIANAAFFYGLLHYFAIQPTPIEYLLPFHLARRNFFHAARFGLHCQFHWFVGQEIGACELTRSLIPLAKKGLQALGIDKEDIEFYLNLIERRVDNKMNGTEWQCRYIEKYGKDFHGLMAVYLENQQQEFPVSEWKI